MPGDVIRFVAPGGSVAVYEPGSAAVPVSERVATLTRATRTVSVFGDDEPGGWKGTREVWIPPAVTAADIPDLRRQMAALDEVLAPAPRDGLLKRVLVLLAHYRTDPLPPDVEAAIAQDWADDLDGFPLWAIEEAARMWRRDPKKFRFKPHPNDIRLLCAEVIARESTMRDRVARLLKAAGADGATATSPGEGRGGDVRSRIAALAASKRMP